MVYDDRASVEKLSEIDPELAEMLKGITMPPPPDMSDYKGRRLESDNRTKATLQAIGPVGPDISESYQDISMRDDYASRIKIIKPADMSASKTHPLIILYYGGGFVSGNCDQLTAYGRSFARVFGAVTVCPNYRLAPEHPFPHSTHDGWDTLKWVAANAKSLGATPEDGFVVGGVSAGAHISGVIAQLAQDEGLTPKLTGQFLSIPALFTHEQVPEKYKELHFSMEQNANCVGMDTKMVEAFNGYWKPDVKSVYYTPLNAEKPLVGLPPAYIQVDGMDPLRDDGLVYEKMLKDQGIKTRLDVYPGLPHAHWAFFPMLKSSKKTGMDTVKGMGWLLGHEVDDATAAKSMAVAGAA